MALHSLLCWCAVKNLLTHSLTHCQLYIASFISICCYCLHARYPAWYIPNLLQPTRMTAMALTRWLAVTNTALNIRSISTSRKKPFAKVVFPCVYKLLRSNGPNYEQLNSICPIVVRCLYKLNVLFFLSFFLVTKRFLLSSGPAQTISELPDRRVRVHGAKRSGSQWIIIIINKPTKGRLASYRL